MLGICFNNEQNYSNWSTPVEREEHICKWDTEWTYKNGVYTSVDAVAIQAFLDFTAPCFLNYDATNANYLTLTKVTVQETSLD